MLRFFKKMKSTIDAKLISDEAALELEQTGVQDTSLADFIAEHDYKMEHDPEYRKLIEQSHAFFEADNEAREKAGLKDKEGVYTFQCPNCGSPCRGSWVWMKPNNEMHGYTGCSTCDIHLRV